MKKYSAGFQILILLLIMTLAITAKATSDPVSMLKSVADAMLNSLQTHKTTLKKNPTVVYDMARKIIVPHADLSEMTKRVLPPQIWNTATTAQRTTFQQEFTTTLIRTYASALASYEDQTVKFFPVRGSVSGLNAVNVNSQIIRPDGPPVSVSYSLVKKGSVWKLFDITVEGVSMLESFRSQFAAQLNHGDMASLLQVLQQHNADNAKE